MASLTEELEGEINSILAQAWDIRDGQVVPEPETVALAGGAVKLQATFLYSDLADSTGIAMHDKRIAARLFKAFLAMSTRLIVERGGKIRSFDGDRVMGVFVGDYKCTAATKCALQINYIFRNVIKPKFEARYEVFRNGQYTLAHCTGVDMGEVLTVRSGIRNNNDLVWVGRAPNVAAKLSAFRNTPYHSYITGEVYDLANAEAKVGSDGRDMWEERKWTDGPVERMFRSSWWWKP